MIGELFKKHFRADRIIDTGIKERKHSDKKFIPIKEVLITRDELINFFAENLRKEGIGIEQFFYNLSLEVEQRIGEINAEIYADLQYEMMRENEVLKDELN